MHNWKQPPIDSEIAKYVDCYWYLEKEPSDTSHSEPRLNPCPEAHLILAPSNQSYHYTVKGADRSGVGSHLLLPSTSSVQLHHNDPFVIIGIKFKVGALYSLAHASNMPVLDDIIDAPDFLSAQLPSQPMVSTGLTKQVAIDVLRKALDQWLLVLLAKSHEDNYSQLTRKAIELLEDGEIAGLSQQMHCSRRTIERAFRQVTGLTLKQYDAMRTLDRILYYLYQDSKPDWADVAARFGFSDQPHLIRYLKSAICATPGSYIKQRDLTIDVYGDFE